jgi:predicted XRE-type DNA-binding protein
MDATDPIPALKQQLADALLARLANLNVSIAAMVLEVDDARMSDLRHGRVARFSVERLIRLLAKVDQRVTLAIVNEGTHDVRWFRILRERRKASRDSLGP